MILAPEFKNEVAELLVKCLSLETTSMLIKVMLQVRNFLGKFGEQVYRSDVLLE